MRRNLFLYAVIAVLFGSIGAYFANDQIPASTREAPAVHQLFTSALVDLKNQGQAMTQWKGKTLLINFWATWCKPCVQEMPELSALQSAGTYKNLQIIGIGIDSADNMREFSSKYKISYPLYVADMTGSALLREFGDSAGGLPFSVLISPDGQIKKTYIGALKFDEVRHDLATR